jgi:high-affinity iron transporter
MDSALGTLAHALVGYEARPTGMQLTFYVLALATIVQGSRWVRQAQSARRTGGPFRRAPSS